MGMNIKIISLKSPKSIISPQFPFFCNDMLIEMVFAGKLGNDHMLKVTIFVYDFEKLTVSTLE